MYAETFKSAPGGSQKRFSQLQRWSCDFFLPSCELEGVSSLRQAGLAAGSGHFSAANGVLLQAGFCGRQGHFFVAGGKMPENPLRMQLRVKRSGIAPQFPAQNHSEAHFEREIAHEPARDLP